MSAVLPASRRRHLLLSFFLFLLLGFHVGVWAVQLGSLSAALRLDPGELGTALSCAAAGGIVTLFLGGRIADRFGRRAVLLLGFGITGLAFAGLAAARNFPEVLVAVAVYGLAVSFVDLGANTVGSDFESAYDTQALTGLQAGFSLGALLGALSSALVLAGGVDYRLVYVALGAVCVSAALVCGRATLPVRRPMSPPDERPRASRAVRPSRGVLFAAALLLICFFGDGALEGFLAVFLRQALDSGVLLSGIGIAAFHLASFLGRTISSKSRAHLSPGAIITVAGALAALGMTGALLTPNTWGSIAGMLLVGFAISPVVPNALSLAGRSAAPHQAGQAVAFTTAVGYTSFLVGPIVVGTIAATSGLRAGLAVVVATALGITGFGLRWPRSDRPFGKKAASPERPKRWRGRDRPSVLPTVDPARRSPSLPRSDLHPGVSVRRSFLNRLPWVPADLRGLRSSGEAYPTHAAAGRLGVGPHPCLRRHSYPATRLRSGLAHTPRGGSLRGLRGRAPGSPNAVATAADASVCDSPAESRAQQPADRF